MRGVITVGVSYGGYVNAHLRQHIAALAGKEEGRWL